MMTKFQRIITNYHKINRDPIVGQTWEMLSKELLIASDYKIVKIPCQSGIDIRAIKQVNRFNIITKKLSLKTVSTLTQTHMRVSSYRLSKCNTLHDLKKEIAQRSKSYNQYSILTRETKHNIINYKWYVYPKSYSGFDPNNYVWKKTDSGWITYQNPFNSSFMSIYKNSGNQLWINVPIEKKYLKDSVSVNINNARGYLSLPSMEYQYGLC